MTKISWDWIAGFFEGEGNVSWYEGNKATKQGTCGRIVIGQKDRRSLDAIKSFLEENGFTKVLLYLRPASPARRVPNPIWILAINQRGEVIRFIENIAPALFEKQSKSLEIMNRLKSMNRERDDRLAQALELRKQKKTWREIAREIGVGRVALSNYARSKGIDLSRKEFDSKSWRQDRIDRGLCSSCGKARDDSNLARTCRKCQDKNNIRTREWKRQHRLKQKHSRE